ncbi:MAG: hypothetical protein MUF48_03815, partial [Pirellulaceae bacterium]|nr:hypothetical protein [Pirellulaceae bacterium]
MSTPERTRDGALAARMLGALTQGLLRVPRWSLAAGVLLAVLCAVLAGWRLGYHTDRLDLLNPRSAYNQRWLAYLEEFGREDDAIVVFQSGDRRALLAAIDQTAAALAASPESFHGILSRIEVAPLRRKALHYLSAQDLQRVTQGLEQAGPIITGDWARLALASQLRDWTQQASQLAAAPDSPLVAAAYERLSLHLQCLLAALQAALDGHDASAGPAVPLLSDLPAHPLNQLAGDHDGHLLIDNGRTGLLLVRLRKSDEQRLVQGTAAIRRLREVLAGQRPLHPNVHIGLTGLPILEYDEMETSQYDMGAASLISLLGVAVL